VPGVEPGEVEVSVLNDTIKGERKRLDEVKEKDYHYTETAYGSFERRLALPKGIESTRKR